LTEVASGGIAKPRPVDGDADADARGPSRSARRNPRRMAMFRRILLAITAAIQVPFALGAAEAARRIGMPVPWAWGTGLALLALLLFGGRVRAGAPDTRRASSLGLVLVDIPFYVHSTSSAARP